MTPEVAVELGVIDEVVRLSDAKLATLTDGQKAALQAPNGDAVKASTN